MNIYKKIMYTAAFFAAVTGVPAMEKLTDQSGRTYEFVKNDPFNLRIYKLKNGLTVYLSRNTTKPTVSVSVAVKAGSVDESETSTGIAHYFEHMMFKGTPRLGSLDWQTEKKLLNQIEQLFEDHRKETDPAKKMAIYKKIDSLSSEAARYATSGEFSKLASLIGADKLNAMTSYDRTVYVAEVPSNELGKYLRLDAEQFSAPVMRLFHTELEAVYEEFNMMQNRDGSRAFYKIMELLFPGHPLGRPIIGLPEHLKNPSIRDIYAFRSQYYVPENMAVILVGDLDYQKALDEVEATFGKLPSAKVRRKKIPAAKALPARSEYTLTGPEPAQVLCAFRLPRKQDSILKLMMLSRMLCDNGYGLIEQNLELPQKVQAASVFAFPQRDYAAFFMQGMPKKGQTLQNVEELLLQELNKIAEGKFEDWRMDAIVNNLRVDISAMCETDSASLAEDLAEIFATGEPYENFPATAELLSKITKKDLMKFASMLIKSPAVVVFKEQGKSRDLLRVKKPQITPVKLNEHAVSDYAKTFMALPPSPSVNPEFPDPFRILKAVKLQSGITLRYDTRRRKMKLFTLKFHSPYSTHHDRKLSFALDFMDYLGSDRYSAAELRQEFYKLGVKFSFSSNKDGSFAELFGPEKNMKKAVELFSHFLQNAKPDQEALKRYKAYVQKERANGKAKQIKAFYRMVNYSLYGKDHPYAFVISDAEMAKIQAEELTALVKRVLTSSDISVIYSGTESLKNVSEIMSGFAVSPSGKTVPRHVFKSRLPKKTTVYLLDFDSNQIQVGFAATGKMFDKDRVAMAELFNEYFGFGLDSVVFQEIRESRALAYNAGAAYSTSDLVGRHDAVFALIQTQPTKLFDAIDAMQSILKKMPVSEPKFLYSKNAIVKKTETRRYNQLELYDYELRLKHMGATADWRKKLFKDLKNYSMQDVQSFFNENVSKPIYDLLIVGRLSAEDKAKLAKYGKVQEMNLKDIYGY